MKVNIFLDDYRQPQQSWTYTKNEIYLSEKWELAKNYYQFCKLIRYIERIGAEIGIVSFDHDLADGYYHKNMQEGVINYNAEDFENDANKTGYHCAKYLVDYCLDNDLKCPDFLCHSMNPVGKENILSLMNSFKKSQLCSSGE